MATHAQKLVAAISHNVEKLQGVLTDNKLPALSIEQDVSLPFQFRPDFAAPRDAALLACRELLALLSGSFGTLTAQTTVGFANTQAVCRFNIASSFPQDRDTATYDELAHGCGLPEPEVRRIVRALLPGYVFQEKGNGTVAHTAASRMLAENPLMRQWIDMTATEMLPATLKIADAMQKWPGSEEPNQSGYSLANNTDDTAFAHMAKFPDRPERFAAAMSLFSKGPGYSPTWLVENYPWGQLGNGTIVDVGGSNGAYSIPIAQAFPNLSCIVQDLPEVVEKAKANLIPDLRDRVTFMTHDFFTEQPVQGADVYLMRWILHDWSDNYAMRILQALVPALKSGSKIVLHEYILPEPGQTPTIEDITLSSKDYNRRIFDTSMRALTNGKEREIGDWEVLLAAADPRLKIVKSGTPHGSALGIIEVELKS